MIDVWWLTVPISLDILLFLFFVFFFVIFCFVFLFAILYLFAFTSDIAINFNNSVLPSTHIFPSIYDVRVRSSTMNAFYASGALGDDAYRIWKLNIFITMFLCVFLFFFLLLLCFYRPSHILKFNNRKRK